VRPRRDGDGRASGGAGGRVADHCWCYALAAITAAAGGARGYNASTACHEGINLCVHGAMETGKRAAEQAAASLITAGVTRSRL